MKDASWSTVVASMAECGGRVLVVEDDGELASVLARGLAAEGFGVNIAGDGAEALLLTHDQRFDAIVLDLMLPRLNGFDFCERLRSSGDATPVLVLTARQDEWDEAEALNRGADDYVTKPFSLVVLVAHLRALLRRLGTDRPATYRAGDLVLDVAAHRTWRGETEIQLTPREFALLEFLFSRVGQPVSRRTLLNGVWDWAISDTSNLVEVYIGYLRRKIDLPFDRCAIQTVRGVGYRLDADGG
jgi:two-component system OmpR family response regulator